MILAEDSLNFTDKASKVSQSTRTQVKSRYLTAMPRARISAIRSITIHPSAWAKLDSHDKNRS